MLKKLEGIRQRYEFLSEKLADSQTLLDMAEWQRYSKEQSELTETVEKYAEYTKTEADMAAAFATAEEETDAEMRKLFNDEAYACKERLAELLGDRVHTVIAAGDNDNDAPMLRTADIGYAVANASPLAKEAANRHTVSNEEHAIAAIIGEL